MLPADDPWWDTHTPLLHFRCQCTKTALSQEEAEDEGIDTRGPDVDADEGFGARPAAIEFLKQVENNPNILLTEGGMNRITGRLDKLADEEYAKQQSFAKFVADPKNAERPDLWAKTFPAHWNAERLKRINEGGENTVPPPKAGTPGKVAPEGAIATLADGTQQIKKDGKWVPHNPAGNPAQPAAPQNAAPLAPSAPPTPAVDPAWAQRQLDLGKQQMANGMPRDQVIAGLKHHTVPSPSDF